MTYDFNDLVKIIGQKTEKLLTAGTKFYIPFKGNNEEFVVLGIGVNPNPEEKDIDFMDIMSTRLLLTDIMWQKEISDTTLDDPKFKPLNYINSDLFKVLNEQKQYFPEEINEAIIPRKSKFLTGIDTTSGKLTYSYLSIGDIWVPSLKEIVGEIRYSDDCTVNKQYPYFKDLNNRKLDNCWWTRSAKAFNDCDIYYIDSCGNKYDWYADYNCSVPLCLRLKIIQ